MEDLAGREGDDVVGGGELRSGSATTTTAPAISRPASTWFDQGARDRRSDRRNARRSDFWVGAMPESPRPGAGAGDGRRGEGSDAVLARVARLDGELRVGRVESAVRGYLALERRRASAGCLGPLFYRLGLAATTGKRRRRSRLGRDGRVGSRSAASPEFALVRADAGPVAGARTLASRAGSRTCDRGHLPRSAGRRSGGDSTPARWRRSRLRRGRRAAGAATAEGAAAPSAVPATADFTVQLGSFHRPRRARIARRSGFAGSRPAGPHRSGRGRRRDLAPDPPGSLRHARRGGGVGADPLHRPGVADRPGRP